MIVAIIILSVFLAVALIIIGILLIKNELLLKVAEEATELNEEILSFNCDVKCAQEGMAFDGKYYPCTLLLSVKYNTDMSGIITDFSKYDDKKVIGMTVMNKEEPPKSVKEYLTDLDDGIDDLFTSVVKNALVFQITKGVWDYCIGPK